MSKSSQKAAILAAILVSFLEPAQAVDTYKCTKCQKAHAWIKRHILIPNLGLKVGRGRAQGAHAQ